MLHFQIYIHIQFALPNNNTLSWKGYKQASKTKCINSQTRRQKLKFDCKSCTASSLLILSETAGRQTNMSSHSERLAGFSTCKQTRTSSKIYKCFSRNYVNECLSSLLAAQSHMYSICKGTCSLQPVTRNDNDKSDNGSIGKVLFIKRRKFASS